MERRGEEREASRVMNREVVKVMTCDGETAED